MTWSPGLHALDPRADVDHHPGPLVPEDGGEEPLRIGPGEGELVGVADPGRADLHQDLAGPRAVELQRLQGQRGARLVGDGGTSFHGYPPSAR